MILSYMHDGKWVEVKTDVLRVDFDDDRSLVVEYNYLTAINHDGRSDTRSVDDLYPDE